MERGIIIHDNDGDDDVDFFAAKDGGFMTMRDRRAVP